MHVAIDVDSTLHDYWTQFRSAALTLHDVDLPYERQTSWAVDALTPAQVVEVVSWTHAEEQIAAAEVYPGAREVITGWHAAGHEILITTHRRPGAEDATAAWLEGTGIPFHELRCGWEKVPDCAARGVDLLVDDSPANLAAALDVGMAAATIEHPWNRDLLAAEPRIVAARDWRALAAELAGRHPALALTRGAGGTEIPPDGRGQCRG